MLDDIILSDQEPVNCFGEIPLGILLSESPPKRRDERVMVQQTVKSESPTTTTGQKQRRPYTEGVVSIIEERSSKDDASETARKRSEFPHTPGNVGGLAGLRKIFVSECSCNNAHCTRIDPHLALEGPGKDGCTTDKLGTQFYS